MPTAVRHLQGLAGFSQHCFPRHPTSHAIQALHTSNFFKVAQQITQCVLLQSNERVVGVVDLWSTGATNTQRDVCRKPSNKTTHLALDAYQF